MKRRPSRLNTLLALAHFGGSPLPPRTAMEWLRGFSFSERTSNQTAVSRAALRVFATVGWPFVATKAAWRTTRRQSALPQSQRLTQFAQTVALALTRHVPPVEYAAYNFNDPARRANAKHYLYWTDTSTLTMLNRFRGADVAEVNDKVRFAEICKAHALPHIATLAEFRPGKHLSEEERAALHSTPNLWVKAVNLNASRGTEPWTRTGDRYVNADSLSLTPDGLIEHLSQRTCVVQPRVENHPALVDITNGRLASLRIVTVRKRGGRAMMVGHHLTVPRAAFLTTTGGIGLHVSDDGLVDDVDQSAFRGLTAHPDTGVPFLGHAVPFFHEAVALAEDAHTKAFPRFATLGWDVALTSNGPVLIETNTGWGALGLQVLTGPLGLGPLNDVLEEERAIFNAKR